MELEPNTRLFLVVGKNAEVRRPRTARQRRSVHMYGDLESVGMTALSYRAVRRVRRPFEGALSFPQSPGDPKCAVRVLALSLGNFLLRPRHSLAELSGPKRNLSSNKCSSRRGGAL